MVVAFVDAEIATQPGDWRRAAAVAADRSGALPQPGEAVAAIGCGSSNHMAMAYAALREGAGHGRTDAFAASEMPRDRGYDRVVAISRSGTTTEVLDLLAGLRGRARRVVVTAVPDAPVVEVADEVIDLGFADERSIVQTRFATSALALLRASLGADLREPVADAKAALSAPLHHLLSADQFTFLGTGWTVGLAHEAALKMREAAQMWTEAYPAMEYRHGPISIAQPGRVTWMFGPTPPGLAAEVGRTGAMFIEDDSVDPMAHLIVVQRLAVALAVGRRLDPDRPRHLSRSVVLGTRHRLSTRR